MSAVDGLVAPANGSPICGRWLSRPSPVVGKQPVPEPATSVPQGLLIVKRDAVHWSLVAAVALSEFTRIPPPLRWISAFELALNAPGTLPRSSAMIAYPLLSGSD